MTGPARPAALSHGERSLWFLHHLAPAESAYNIAAAARVRTPVDAGALERAFQALEARHAALRTTFPAIDGEPWRCVSAQGRLTLDCADAAGWSEARLRARLAEEAWRPFDLENGPLVRAALWTGASGGPVLLFVIHHIIADFWSLALLMRELSVLYREAAGGAPAALGPPGLPYEEHVRREQEVLSGGRGEALLDFWKRELAGLPVLDLGTDRPRPAVQTWRGDVCRLRLPGALTSALRAWSRTRHGTLFMTLTAAFQALLGRHSGQEDLAIGTARAGRSQSAMAGTVGYFVNQVVLRGDLSNDPPFAELVERTKRRVQAAFEHGDHPLSLLAERLQPERDASRTPFFQVLFVLQKETRGGEGLTAFAMGEEGVEVGPQDFRLESLVVPRPPAAFDLVLQAVDRQGGLSLSLLYNTDLFDATTMERMAGHFERLLAAAVAAPDGRLSSLPLLSEAEQHALQREWGSAGWEAAGTQTLATLVEAQAARRPEAPALVFTGGRLTYGELAERSRALAGRLRRWGAGPEVLVGVCLEPSPDLVVALFAIWQAGGAFLPLDPAYPPERLAFMVQDSGAPLVVTRRALAELDLPGARRLFVDAWEAPEGGGPAAVAAPRRENLAYLIYTSGSTGRPKGVAVSQGMAADHLGQVMERWGLTPGDRVLQFASPSFDIWLEETVPPLLAGAAVVLRGTEMWEPAGFLARIRALDLTVVDLPTAYWQQWIRDLGEVQPPEGLRLRLVSTGGEAMTAEAARLWFRSPLAGVRLLNGYGPTEAVISATFHPVDGPPATAAAVSLGFPLPGRSAHVLDAGGGLVPVGVAGELCLGGAGLARGYLRRPELTAERFIPDPFSAVAGGRLYRTGDLARRLADGSLDYLGRIDQQVKVRGYRIELGEIEAALESHPAVSAAVVLAGRDPAGGTSLVAYVATGGEEVPDPAELPGFLRRRLPEFMLPAGWVFLPALPLTANGKVDRRALAAIRPERKREDDGGSPRTPTEELLAGIFAEILGVERVGLAESFFALGGHSLLATRVTSRVRSVLGIELPLRIVFEEPTVER
ncbi:MAG TPA: non-ribosomal peptide synthetase, partial [Acidobacteria bacterium]|nr:non-ribosomal peptide synthetase [Acidobacteriota bacterium]